MLVCLLNTVEAYSQDDRVIDQHTGIQTYTYKQVNIQKATDGQADVRSGCWYLQIVGCRCWRMLRTPICLIDY